MKKTFANPNKFLKLLTTLMPWFLGIFVVFTAAGLYTAFFTAPIDYQQKDTVRILYVHAPSAYMAMMIYASMAVASLTGLIWKHPLATIYCKSTAFVGMVFAAITLITGSLWGSVMWGTWWQWEDPRLLSVLILFIQYIVYIVLVDSFDDPARGRIIGSYFILLGTVNILFIKFSVTLWNSLHQPPTISKLDTPSITFEMALPLILMTIAFMAFWVYVTAMRIHNEMNKIKQWRSNRG